MQATVKNIFVEGFSSATDTDVVFDWLITLEEEDGTPMLNLDSATTVFNIKRSYADTSPLLTATELDGIDINATNATLRLRLKVSHFDSFSYNREEQEFLYDWDLTDDLGRKYRLYKGTVTLGGDI